jgi:hypothetical protein
MRESIQSRRMSASRRRIQVRRNTRRSRQRWWSFTPTIRACCASLFFGSLGRGDWRPDSDLDLDVVVGHDVHVDVEPELRRLGVAFEAIGEHAALFISLGVDSADVVFESLMRLSIRYHRLATTTPSILSGLLVLGGRLSQAELEAAAGANLRTELRPPLTHAVDECLHYAVSAEGALRAGRVWLAVELPHRARGFLMELFWRARGGVRPIHRFDARRQTPRPSSGLRCQPTIRAPSDWPSVQSWVFWSTIWRTSPARHSPHAPAVGRAHTTPSAHWRLRFCRYWMGSTAEVSNQADREPASKREPPRS